MLFKKAMFSTKAKADKDKKENILKANGNEAGVNGINGEAPVELNQELPQSGAYDPAEQLLVEMNNEPLQTTGNEALLGAIKIDVEAPPPVDKQKDTKQKDSVLGNLDDLFAVEEEEEKTSSDLLVNSLVDVTCEEIIDELKNLNDFIAEMKQQQSQYWGQIYGL